MAKVSEPLSAHQHRQLVAITEFTTDIQHVAGKAECLSRLLMCPVNLGMDFYTMAADQLGDPELVTLRSAATGLKLEKTVICDGGPVLLCDVFTGLTLLCQLLGVAEFLTWFMHSLIRESGHR